MRVGLERIEKRMPFPMLGFDCDNGSEFLNEILEAYLLKRKRSIEWTRSRAYKKNDHAHVEQKKFHPRSATVRLWQIWRSRPQKHGRRALRKSLATPAQLLHPHHETPQ